MMMRLTEICSIYILIFIGTAKCDIMPGIDEVVDLARQASYGFATAAVDQDLNVLFNYFNDACRVRLNENDLKLIRDKMNIINEHVYIVNETYAKFKESLKNVVECELYKPEVTDHVQKIYEEIIDPSDPVIIKILGHNKNTHSNVITKSSASYLFGLLYEVVVYTEIKYLALQFYSYRTSTANNINCWKERTKDKVDFRLTNILNNMNRAVNRFA